MKVVSSRASMSILICALLIACSDSHRPSAGSSGSNWLRCEKLADCAGAKAAVTCSIEGFCIDDAGMRIAADQREAGAAGAAGSAEPLDQCPGNLSALLTRAGAGPEYDERVDCGRFATNDRALVAGITCFANELDRERPVELTVDQCVDCDEPATIVASSASAGFWIVRQADTAAARSLRQVIVAACQEVHVELERPSNLAPDEPGDWPFVGCTGAVERYRCQQPLE